MNSITLDTYIETLYQEAKFNFSEYLKMIFIQADSKFCKKDLDLVKQIDKKQIEDYLKKRGYTMNYILGKSVMIKDFTCVFISETYIEVWHDKTNKNKSVFFNESLLTGLPITLNYFERI